MTNTIYKPKKCTVCGKTALQGPFNYKGAGEVRIRFNWKDYAPVFAYVCRHCGYIMTFTGTQGLNELDRVSTNP